MLRKERVQKKASLSAKKKKKKKRKKKKATVSGEEGKRGMSYVQGCTRANGFPELSPSVAYPRFNVLFFFYVQIFRGFGRIRGAVKQKSWRKRKPTYRLAFEEDRAAYACRSPMLMSDPTAFHSIFQPARANISVQCLH